MKKALIILSAALLCFGCGQQGGTKGGSDKGGSDTKVSDNFSAEGDFYINYKVGSKQEETYVFAVKGSQKRLDFIRPDERYDDAGNVTNVLDQMVYLDNNEGQFVYDDGEWTGDTYTPRGAINSTLASLKINPQKYIDAGFEKTGTVKVLGHELDVYSGYGNMQKKWSGYENGIIGYSGDYKMSFATYGGILFYLTKDDEVYCEAVAASTKVPDSAFEKNLDIAWAK